MFGKPKKPTADQLIADFLTQTQDALPAADKESDLELKFDALWQIVQKKFGLNEGDLEAEISEIKKKRSEAAKQEAAAAPLGIEKCAKCGRTVSAKTGICIYCGKDDS